MTSLKGNLNSVDLANIFQMLSLNQREGTLYIFEGASRKAIYFGGGSVSMLSKGKSKSDALGRILLRYDRITPEQLADALKKREGSGRLLGQVLVEEGTCSRSFIEEALQIQIEEEVYSLFIWKDAQFEFVEGDPDEEFLAEGVQKLTFNVNSLIMEAAKRVDEWEWIQSVVPDSQEVFRYTGRNVDLTDAIFQEPYSGKVLAAIDGRRSADEIIEASYVNRFEVSKILAILSEGGAIEKLPVPDLRREAEAAVAGGDTDAAVKFLSRLVAVKGDTPEMHKQLAEAFEGEHQLEKAALHYRVYAEIRADQREVREAFLVYKRVCEFLPTDLTAADRMIEVFSINPDGLEEHAKEIIERGKQLAEIYVELKRSSRAIQVLHRVVSLGPDDPDLRNRLISVYLASGMPGEAISEYDALADTAIAVKDFETAEKIYRKILTIDRTRDDVVSRLNQILSKKKRRQQNVRNLVIGGVLILAAAVGSWYALDWYKERRDAQATREKDSQARLQDIGLRAASVEKDVAKLLQEFANRPVDLVQLAAALRERTPRVDAADKAANGIVGSLTQLRAEFQGMKAETDAAELISGLSGPLTNLKKRVLEIQKTLRENAESDLEKAHEGMAAGTPTREILAKLDHAAKIAEDCPGWSSSEKGGECAVFRTQLQEYLRKFETTKSAVEQKLAAEDVDGAWKLAFDYITATDYPPPDLREEMPLPIRILSRPAGARVLWRDGRDTGQVTGPACVITISVPKGAMIDLDLPGFAKGVVEIPPVKDVDPQVVSKKIKQRYDVALEPEMAFRRGTSDNKAVAAAPFASPRYVAVPSLRTCEIIGLAKRNHVQTLQFTSERVCRASGVILEKEDDATVVLPTAEGTLLTFDAVTGKSGGSWTEAHGGIQLDLALSGENVLAADERGHLHLVSIGKRLRLWEYAAVNKAGEPVRFSTAPVVCGNEVWIGCENGSVHVVDLKTGESVRKILPQSAEAGNSVSAPVSVCDGSAYFVNREAAKQSRLTKANAATGRVEWSVNVAGDVRSAPMVQDGTVYLVTVAGEILSLKALDGQQTHSDVLDRGGVKAQTEAVLEDSVLYVGGDNGVLYAFDVRGQHVEALWKFPVRNGSGKTVPATTRCVFAAGLVLFGAADNAVYAIEGGH